ncbi:site-2 protease family protein [Xylanimonas ulmi]|uniref:Zinc metalloprotease n=1 Tax=Xylanimonas ulmi TaxID=228973 RepID=A0A4Q7M095_9MICO|nr:site-2 protease family protein [Xylanibacterium ulmi]RZS60561.1 Zn-dependent protease [Xylanibacterium ulmi]
MPTPATRTRGWVIGRVAGAPVIVTPSWFLAAVVLTLVFAPTVRSFAPRLSDGGVVVVAFAFVLLLFASVFCHEAAHALVARSRGHRVTELAMTLWGGHTAYTGAQRRPLDGALVAVVGPLTNLLLAGVFWAAFGAAPAASVPAMLLYAAFFSNVFVGLFNLLPGLPLDGGQLLEALVWRVTGSRMRGTVAAGWVGRAVAVGVLAWALLWPVARGLAPSVTTVIWSAVVGAFLWSGAGEAITTARRRAVVDSIATASLAGRAVVVATGTRLGDAARAVAGVPDAAVVVTDAWGAPLGWVDPAAAAAVPPGAVGVTPVDAAVVPFPPGSAVDDSLGGAALLEHLAATSAGARIVPVVRGGRVTGVLDVARVAAAVRGPAR